MSAQYIYRLLADFVVWMHFLFVLFVVFGGLLAVKWHRIVWLHLIAAVWGAMIEFSGWICPLTPLENWLRQEGGASGYRSDFVAQYLLPVLYPEGLTRKVQITLGIFVIVINLVIYSWVLRRGKTK